MELYQNDDMFAELCSKMYEYYRHRSSKLKECNINCLHLMPFLDTPEGRSDGGYAVADFRKIRPDLGTVKRQNWQKSVMRKISMCVWSMMTVSFAYYVNIREEDFLEYSTSVIRRRQRGCRKMEYIVIC